MTVFGVTSKTTPCSLSHIVTAINPVRGKPLVKLLRPDEDDYFVLKPKHSGFYSTALDTLRRLVTQ